MPTRDQVLQVPFVGGIDESTDPDQLQPPGMASLVNCVVRKPGRVEKREGFSFINQSGSTTVPATAFGGTNTVLPASHEALGTNSGADGSRLLVAADSTLFEYVGSDATHGYREVNRLPSCIGTLHPVNASGGQVTEVESIIEPTGLYRCTAWILGSRNGRDLTDDTAIREQPADTHGLYVAVQRVSDGTFVTPATRIKDWAGNDTVKCRNLRMFLGRANDGSTHWVVACQTGSLFNGFVVNSSTGTILASRSLGALVPTYWRSFDAVGVFEKDYFLLAKCDADSQVANSDVTLELWSFSATTGVFTLVFSFGANLLASVGAFGTTTLSEYDWARFTTRGVVLERSPTDTNVSIAVRTIYEKAAPAPRYLDGKFVTTMVDCANSTITATLNRFAWAHKAAFQTQDDFDSFQAGAGEVKKSGSVTKTTNASPYVQSLFWAGPPNPAGGTGLGGGSAIATITALFADGSKQAYTANFAGYVDPRLGTTGTVYDNPKVASGIVDWSNQPTPNIAASGKFPTPLHAYPRTGKVALSKFTSVGTASLDTAVVDKRAITRVRIMPGGTAVAIPGAPTNTVTYVEFSVALGPIARALVAFGAAGEILEVALYDGRVPGTAANINAAPSAWVINSFTTSANPNGPFAGVVAIPGVPGAVVEGYDEFNDASASYGNDGAWEDVGVNVTPEQQVAFDIDSGLEHCVHRWDVARFTSSVVVLAVSSTSAGTYSDPNGAAPFGYVSPFTRNNYFEVYPWEPGPWTRHDLNSYSTSAAQPLWVAMGGPWRMMSTLVKMPSGRMACIITPSGDIGQRSAFLVSFKDNNATMSQVIEDGVPVQSADGVTYSGNPGVFIESLNMARVAAPPLNCPSLMVASSGVISAGTIRQGQNFDGSEVFALDYDCNAQLWRKLAQWGDYTVVNGGVASLFDGSSCDEVAPLVWPQRDMTSIAYDRSASKVYLQESSSTNPSSFQSANWTFWYGASTTTYNQYSVPLLWNITRPWFAYEAGLFDKNGNKPDGSVAAGAGAGSTGYGFIQTSWGGDPTKDYQSVYVDPRLQQFKRFSGAAPAGVNEVSLQHYYGRYQSGYARTTKLSATDTTRLVNWAPRTAPGKETDVTIGEWLLKDIYQPIVSNGDFLASWCYEWVDGTGRVARSSPSQPVAFTICSNIKYTLGSSILKNEPLPGGSVEEYRYGFFVPRLELTNRQKTAVSDPKRTVLQPYFTAEPFATVFYKAPFSNFLSEYASDFTISRNVTRGVVPYASKNAGVLGLNPNGIATNNLACFDGPQGDYNGILSQPLLYTTGNVLDNVAPPSAKAMCVHQNRLVIGGADDPTVVWFSKELSPTDAPGFNDALTIQIEDGGPVTGLASLESVLVIFKKGMTWLIPGDMPDDTGGAVNRGYVSNTLGTPVKMPHGIGCIDHRSVVETPIGVFFQSSRTIELLSRDMSITPVGLKLDDLLTTYATITSAFHNAKDTEVWFSVKPGGEGSIPVFFVYNYLTDTWSLHNVQIDVNPVTLPATIMDGNVYFASRWLDPTGSQPTQTVVYKQVESQFFDVKPGARVYVSMSWTTAPLALNNVQGYQRLKRVRLQGSPIPTKSTGAPQTRNPHAASFSLQTDFSTTTPNNGLQTVNWTEAQVNQVYADQNREVFEVHVAEQKGERVVVSYTELAPANLNALTHGYGTAFSNLSFVVGLKAGLDKRITSEAKH